MKCQPYLANEALFVCKKICTSMWHKLSAYKQFLLSTTDLAQFEGAESNIISQLIVAAENVENLCRMDPAWNAWI